MAEASYPAATYNAGAVTDAEYQRLPHAPDGLVGLPSESAAQEAVYANSSGREVHLRAGRYGYVLGRAWTSGTTGGTLPVTANASGSTRVDTVVLRLDRATWLVRAAIREGTPGAGPPALVRDDADTGLFEIPLADVTVVNGAAVITAADVRMRALYHAGAIRPVKAAADVTGLLSAGDIVYQGDRWLGWNGTTQRVLAEDTGWATLPLNGSDKIAWTVRDPCRYRRVNSLVHVRFSIQRWDDNPLRLSDENGSTPFVLPAGFRPASSSPPVLGWGNHSRNALQLFIYPAGDIRVYPLNADLAAGRRIYAQAQFPIG